MDNTIGERNILFWCGLSLVLFGILSFVIEQIFYGYIDEQGVLHETFFLPLTFFLGGLGIVLIVISKIKSAAKLSL